jgi:hypothetical protein
VSESEARRMGLAIREVQAYAVGSTQVKNPARLAVGSRTALWIGAPPQCRVPRADRPGALYFAVEVSDSRGTGRARDTLSRVCGDLSARHAHAG